ncbi:unnamed protein product [Cuscuta campestris]|uniref:Uncharacterized protein n=1 Tax=Cuscuta campestris TaxID=132261 RepID=A0A484KRF1_9ASTE|nr:unnamed protein product [Cuscuta campestris]
MIDIYTVGVPTSENKDEYHLHILKDEALPISLSFWVRIVDPDFICKWLILPDTLSVVLGPPEFLHGIRAGPVRV